MINSKTPEVPQNRASETLPDAAAQLSQLSEHIGHMSPDFLDKRVTEIQTNRDREAAVSRSVVSMHPEIALNVPMAYRTAA